MKYNTAIDSLEAFYETLYSIPARTDRQSTTPQAVTEQLLTALGNPEKQFRSVLVTGSKGKGSTTILLSALIKRSGAKVGRFLSPHLFDYRERMVINDKLIKADDLLRLARRVFTVANELPLASDDDFPRFFEITTAIAYLYFAEQYVDIAVIETGIGALTDATNQKAHEISILTHIEEEHGDIFGTLEEITEEKSGVLKRDTPLILGDLPDEVDYIIIDKAARLNVPVTRFKRQYTPNNNGYYQVKVGDEVWITDSMIKAKNGWIALTAFQKLSIALDDAEKVQALSEASLPARQEIISTAPFIIIDTAHSADSAQVLANYIRKMTNDDEKRNITLLLSFSSEKNVFPVFSAFSQATQIVVTQATDSRSLTPDAIKTLLSPHTSAKITTINNPEQAFTLTVNKLCENDIFVVTGSVYLAGLISQKAKKLPSKQSI